MILFALSSSPESPKPRKSPLTENVDADRAPVSRVPQTVESQIFRNRETEFNHLPLAATITHIEHTKDWRKRGRMKQPAHLTCNRSIKPLCVKPLDERPNIETRWAGLVAVFVSARAPGASGGDGRKP